MPIATFARLISPLAFATVLAACACNTALPSSNSAAEEDLAPFQVRVEGDGRPMILIPGLLCDGTVWDETVAHFADRYECHVLSLAGFAGVPPVEGPFIPTMRDAVVQYIQDKELENPVIVGHSLGGHLALAVAVEAPQEVGPVVVVDGATALGLLMFPGTPAEAIVRQSEAMTTAMAAMPQEGFAAQNRYMFGLYVQNPKTAEELSENAAKSDIKTAARAMHEVMTADLREEVAAITSPVLMIGAAEYAKDDAAKAAVHERYEQQVALIPNHRVVMAYDARHFVMLDQPSFFFSLVEEFLAASTE